MSDNTSITASFDSNGSIGENPKTDLEPQDLQPEDAPVNQYDTRSVYSNYSGMSSLRPAETVKTLQDAGVQSKPPPADLSAPTRVQDPMFPEEYTLETATGLVPVATLRSLGRVTSLRRVVSGRPVEGEKPPEVDESVEFVTFKLHDPENPHNWPTALRWYYTAVVSMLVVAVAFGSSCVTGGLGLISEKYHVSEEVSVLTCSLMVVGFAVGPLLWSPLSEQIGRRPVYIISLALYTIFNIPCALSPNIGGLLVCRFLCGVFSSSGLSLVGGTIADIFSREERGLAIAFFAAAPYGGPVLGPVVCGWINIGSGRLDLIFWVNMAFAGVITVLVGLIPETFAPVILKRRAARMRKETGNEKIMTEQEAEKLTFMQLLQTVLIRPLYLIATEPVLDLMNMYVVLIYSLLYAFFFAYPVIFGELYGYNDGIIGLMFIPILIGAGLALGTTPVVERKYAALCRRRDPIPEDRLIGAMIGAAFIPVSLFILGATSYKHVIWVGPASAGLAFGYGMVMVYYSVNNYIIDAYCKFAASALAAKVFVRSAGGAAFPLFTTQMYHALGKQWASWLLAFISLAMVVIPFAFYRYGPAIRAKLSKDDYAE